MSATPQDVLEFWFGDGRRDIDAIGDRKKLWWAGGDAVDREIETRFGETHAAACAGDLGTWRETAEGRMALILVYDQFSRNLRRGTADAFANDTRAQDLVLEGRALGFDRQLAPVERPFFYMPLCHAEDLAMQELAVQVFEAMKERDPDPRLDYSGFVKHAHQHRDIVARFGRFPHRNEILGREATTKEREYLANGAPTFGQKK
ncbi:MAG: DUF924 family protein [Myxococcota bacterium]